MINWERLAKANRRGVSRSLKKAKPKKTVKPKPKSPRTAKIVHPKVIKPKVIKMAEKHDQKKEPKNDTPKEKKDSSGEKKDSTGVRQEITSISPPPSEYGKTREKELADAQPEAIAAAREKEDKKQTKK